ncbi:shikimate kinase [Sporolituus thermophilus]|uniref:Shikimate kinase n=1 Tax=Sporolituus thermophilus DSM 23256 TaxID=1123285 RepID=A0A1G7LAM5_9FIRM|nr:shikimate kinase [Sporolituus thermophilus]SDF46436.1 shikimate kinase [Sporolituus thermophilus DSM 23256]
MKNIVLIGFMGTGKTTTGRILANQLGRTFIDIDQEIEAKCKLRVEEIFAIHGEPFFREQERCAIQAVSRYDNAVVATGGGAVLYPENVKWLKQNSVVICLQAAPEVILRRVENDKVQRPLLKRPDKLQAIEQLLQERTRHYAVADFAIETSTITPLRVSELIIGFLRARGELA